MTEGKIQRVPHVLDLYNTLSFFLKNSYNIFTQKFFGMHYFQRNNR